MNILRLARTGFLLSMLLSLFVVVPLEEQRGSQRGRRGQGQGPERRELERRVRARMAEMMREQLGLSDEEDARLSEIVQGFEQQRRQLGRQERAVRLRVESLVLEGGQDSAEAARWFRRAADQGDATAQQNLGVMYANGEGVPRDVVAAHMWLGLAAAQATGAARASARQGQAVVARQLTPTQIAEAERRARAWTPVSEP